MVFHRLPQNNQFCLVFHRLHKKTIRLSIIEQIGTNYFRNDELLKAKEYFDLLPFNFLPSKSINNNYSRTGISYFTFKINFSLSDTLNEKNFKFLLSSSSSERSINKENTLYLKKCSFGLNLLWITFPL